MKNQKTVSHFQGNITEANNEMTQYSDQIRSRYNLAHWSKGKHAYNK